MQEMCSSNPPVVTEICDPNKPRARCYPSLKLGVETPQNLVYYHRRLSNENISALNNQYY